MGCFMPTKMSKEAEEELRLLCHARFMGWRNSDEDSPSGDWRFVRPDGVKVRIANGNLKEFEAALWADRERYQSTLASQWEGL
jgi:hypothetical protein